MQENNFDSQIEPVSLEKYIKENNSNKMINLQFEYFKWRKLYN